MFPSNPETRPVRLDLLDGWRSLAVLCMIGWHFAWDLVSFGKLPESFTAGAFMIGLRYFISCSFILLAAFSCRLSRNNLRRGLITLGCAAVVSIAGALIGYPIRFGILHLLGCGMLLYALIGKWFEKLPPVPTALICLLLFAATLPVMQHVRVNVSWLWIVGLRQKGFYSADYYPLMPWLFLFMGGTVLGRKVLDAPGRWKLIRLPAAATWPGRHALIIYMLHQPVLYGIAWLLART